MSGLGHVLLTLRAPGLTLRQDAIVVVNGGQPESELKPTAGQNPLQRRDARLALSALNPGDL
jgi:hypothetical protein